MHSHRFISRGVTYQLCVRDEARFCPPGWERVQGLLAWSILRDEYLRDPSGIERYARRRWSDVFYQFVVGSNGIVACLDQLAFMDEDKTLMVLYRVDPEVAEAQREAEGPGGAPAVERDREDASPEPWISVVLRYEHGPDDEGARYEIELPDGTHRSGSFDAQGREFIERICSGGRCRIREIKTPQKVDQKDDQNCER